MKLISITTNISNNMFNVNLVMSIYVHNKLMNLPDLVFTRSVYYKLTSGYNPGNKKTIKYLSGMNCSRTVEEHFC